MRISDWSSDVCSSDLIGGDVVAAAVGQAGERDRGGGRRASISDRTDPSGRRRADRPAGRGVQGAAAVGPDRRGAARIRSEEHTSELQSLMRISYAVFCLKKKTIHPPYHHTHPQPQPQATHCTQQPIHTMTNKPTPPLT